MAAMKSVKCQASFFAIRRAVAFWFSWLWTWVFDNTNAASNFIWIQKGIGLYLIFRYFAVLPHATVLLSDKGVNVPWIFDFPEPAPMFAIALVLAVICLGGAIFLGQCRAWVWWVCLLLHFYLACVGLGCGGGAYEWIGLFSMIVIALGMTLGEKTWAVRVLQVYIVNIYFWAGMHKLAGGVWLEGGQIRRVLTIGWGGAEVNFDFLPLLSNGTLSTIMERGVIVGELIVPILLLLPLKYKILPIGAAFCFHISTGLFMNLGEFMNTPMLTLGFLTPADRKILYRASRVLFSTNHNSAEGDEGSTPKAETPPLRGRGSF
jgi:hypothetical protein